MTTQAPSIRGVDYGNASIRDFQITGSDDKGNVNLMEINGRSVKPSGRFWTSLCCAYSTHGLSTKLFRLFTHEEVFARVYDRLGGNGGDRLRFAIEDNGDGPGTLLAVTNPTKALVEYDNVKATLDTYAAVGVEYKDGIVRSTHTPAHMDDFEVGPDKFAHRYVMETPIDGFGKPLIYLSLLRMVCSNGMIGYAKAFRSEVGLGTGNDNPIFTLERALDSFSNEEGYAALRQRFEKAGESWASIAESQKIYHTILKMAQCSMFKDPKGHKGTIDDLYDRRTAALGVSVNIDAGGDGASAIDSPINIRVMRAFSCLVGDLVHIYSLTNVDAISRKKQAQLSCRCTMYELLNFVTELATHYCSEKDGRLLQAEVGNFVSNEYDLEGTKEARPEFADWFLDAGEVERIGEG